MSGSSSPVSTEGFHHMCGHSYTSQGSSFSFTNDPYEAYNK